MPSLRDEQQPRTFRAVLRVPHCGTPRAGNAMSQRLLALTRAGCAARAGLTARLAVY
jgi:hypothetical protein